MRYLTFALTKGRLADKTLAILEKIGITCEEMKDKDSRKLIFVNEELKLRFFLAKGPDVPTYVELSLIHIFRVFHTKDLKQLERFHRQLDIIAEGYRAQAVYHNIGHQPGKSCIS